MSFVIAKSENGVEMSDVGAFIGTPKQPASMKSLMVDCVVVDMADDELRVEEAMVELEESGM